MIIDTTQSKIEQESDCGSFVSAIYDIERLNELFYHVNMGAIPVSINMHKDTIANWDKSSEFQSFFNEDMTQFRGIALIKDSTVEAHGAWLFSNRPD